MPLQAVCSEDASPPIGPYVQGLKLNNLLFISGQIPVNAKGEIISGTIQETTEAVFANLTAILKAGGSSLDNVAKTTIFLCDMADFQGMNSVYAKHFGAHKPTRSCVAVKSLPKGVNVEIECIAAVP